MTLEEFAQLIPGLAGMSHVDKIKHLAWYVLTQDGRDRFTTADVRRCYDQLHYAPPGNISTQLQQLADKRQPELLKDSRGFRLEGRVKEQLDAKYGTRPETVAVTVALQNLPGTISDEAERLFLSEALICFQHKAFRATIVMMWNLAYDHLLTWIVAKHLATFNAAIVRKYPKRTGIAMMKKEDFGDEFKEFEVIEVCGTAGLLTGNIKKIMNEKLNRRNMAAHPSLVEMGQHQAEDLITDLVDNVILKLS